MRKLLPIELEWIHTRLKSMQIRYSEVYEEIFDHYCFALENTLAEDSPKIIAKLNEDFAWSVVKRMDKIRRKASNQQLNKMQLETLKIWNLKGTSLILLFIILAISISISYWLGTFAFISWVGIVGFSGIILLYLKHRSALNFSLNPWEGKTTNSFSHVLYSRFSFFLGIFPYAFIGIDKVNFDRLYSGSQFFTVSNIAFVLLLLYGLSLIKVVLDHQVTKIKLSRN
ncbi:MAG: hypothetical protein P8O16_14970 [Algoriphagus sp.]|uniref:hypothetical protein n=1 Tax=Algoriphagus sp. TaxID=1872435 RepID=UPI0026216005|nr:hypothetical protein [Algoriphagus sp.]MDG1278583.1 hypothetical protein [Algoriphagus sp.]